MLFKKTWANVNDEGELEHEFIYDGKVKAANQYTIRIEGMDKDYFGYKDISKKVCIKGITPKKSYFKLSKNTFDFDTRNAEITWELTPAAKKAGLDESYFGMYTPSYNASPGKYSVTFYSTHDSVDRSVEPKLNFTRKKIDLKTAMERGYINFFASEEICGATGEFPREILVGYATYKNGYGTAYMWYNQDEDWVPIPLGGDKGGYGREKLMLKYNAKKKKAGNEGTLSIKTSGLFNGSYSLDYSIKERYVSETTIPVITSDHYMTINNKKTSYIKSGTQINYRISILINSIVAKVTDGNLAVGESMDNPKVELFRAYYKNKSDRKNGRLSLAPIDKNCYTAVPEMMTDNLAGIKIIGNGQTDLGGIEFGDNVYLGGNYSVYEQAATVVGATVTYNGKEYTFDKKSKISIPYEGRQIRFDRGEGNGITSVTVQLSDENKTQLTLGKDDFTVFYGENITSGANAGNFTIVLKRNSRNGTYKYGGSGQFKFSVTDSDKIVF